MSCQVVEESLPRASPVLGARGVGEFWPAPAWLPRGVVGVAVGGLVGTEVVVVVVAGVVAEAVGVVGEAVGVVGEAVGVVV